MRHRVSIVLALCGLSLLAAPVPGRTQDLTPDRVQYALDVTDRRIEYAQLLVSNSDDDQARTELGFAVDLQARAKNAFAAAQLALAARLTIDARGHADRAIAVVKGLPDPDRVVAQLERTREMVDRARERIEECNDERARSMVRVALEMQERSESAAQSGRYLAALQLTMSARERTLKALRMCRLEEDLQESAERALRRTDEVIARAREVVGAGANDAARRALSRAVDLQGEATREDRAEHFDASLRLTTSARAFAHRAVRLSGGTR
jgi:DNA-binding transcriptional ArsR family regulator